MWPLLRALRPLLVVLSAVLAVPAACAESPDASYLLDEQCPRLAQLVAPIGDFRVVSAQSEECIIGLVPARPLPGARPDQVIGVVHLMRVARGMVPRVHSRHFVIDIGDMSGGNVATDQLIHAARMIADSDGGGDDQPTRIEISGRGQVLEAALLCWLAALVVLVIQRRRGRGEIHVELRLPHLIPVLIQSSIFTYWALYFTGVRSQASFILAEILLGFGADAALSLARFGSWRIGASPLPIVLSANLFVWFDAPGGILSVLCAFASKTLLRRPGAAHIFNPSALGLTTAGIASYVFPDLIHVEGLFHTLSLAPNLAELILLLALIPQTRFRVLPASLAAVLALRLTGNPTVLRPPMILVATLLLTDPATLPKSDIGKILAGLLYGFAMAATSWLLRRAGFIDDFAKVMPVPIVNVLAPDLDWLAMRLSSSVAAAYAVVRRRIEGGGPHVVLGRAADRVAAIARGRVPNYALIAIWLLISIPPLAEEKAWSFEPALHWSWGTPLIRRDADDVPRCRDNPAFCRPFQFITEATLWRERLLGPPTRKP